MITNPQGINGWGTTRPQLLITDRIEQYTKRTDTCWFWTGRCDKDGYGRMKIAGKHYRVPRVVWEINNGPIPPNQIVRHSCDVSACINPAHLLLGTHQDNVDDKMERGRHRGNYKLTLEQREEFCRRGKIENVLNLAKEFGISRTQAYRIVGGKNKKRAVE